MASEAGWASLAYSSRGVGESEGDFSLDGWLGDLEGAVAHLRESVPCDGVWIVGFGTGLVSFVPYFGMLIGFAVGIVIAIVQFGDAVSVAMVAGGFLIGQFIEGNFVTPNLVGERIGLHPVWVIFSLLAGGALLGFVGVLIAVPTAAVIGVLLRFSIDEYLESPLYLHDAPDESGSGGGAGDGSS